MKISELVDLMKKLEEDIPGIKWEAKSKDVSFKKERSEEGRKDEEI